MWNNKLWNSMMRLLPERAREWCWLNLDPDNCCGLLHDLIEWWNTKAVRFLTPHLKNAREFLSFCLEENDTKLLWYKANFFRARTRDENQYYFNAWVNLLGHVTITRSQWINSNGEPKNLFMFGIINVLCKSDKDKEEEIDVLVEHKETIFSGWILTKEQARQARQKILLHKEFSWWEVGVKRHLLVDAIKPKNGKEFIDRLYNGILKKYFPETEDIHSLFMKYDSMEKFDEIFCAIGLEEAKELAGEK